MLRSLVNNKLCKVIVPKDDSCTMFSFVLLMESKEQRDAVRKRLIEVHVYPAILWNIPDSASITSKDFSNRMLSIHCDGRYSEDDIRQLAAVLNRTFEIR